MEKYCYLDQIESDVCTFITDHFDDIKALDPDERADYIHEQCWIDDGVTGNASGSYTFNAWEAEENLCHNFDLLEEAACEFGDSIERLVEKGPEICDVTIRCYLLGQAIANVIDDFDFGNEEE